MSLNFLIIKWVHPLGYRNVERNGYSITFKNGYTSGSGSNMTINNNIFIPVYVIGYKF